MAKSPVARYLCHLVIGIDPCEGSRCRCGKYTESLFADRFGKHEGANFRLRLLNDLKLRCVKDFLIIVVDDLKVFPVTIETVFPNTSVQTCIVHLFQYCCLMLHTRSARLPR